MQNFNGQSTLCKENGVIKLLIPLTGLKKQSMEKLLKAMGSIFNMPSKLAWLDTKGILQSLKEMLHVI